MSWLASWREARVLRSFKKIGTGCKVTGINIEVKGKVTLGDHCIIRGNVVLRTHKQGHITLGNGVEISDYALFQVNDEVIIGDNTYIGPFVVARDTNHLFQGTDIHWRLTPHITEPIRIGKNCFIGANSYLMPGVTIGDGALISPGSIINRDIGPGEVWGGSPAHKMAHRTDDAQRPKRKREFDLISMYGFIPEEGEV